MTPSDDAVLDATAVTAITGHLNDDHAADTLLLCRTLGGEPRATSATAVGIDHAGLDLLAEVEGASRPVRVTFLEPISSRAEVRQAVVALYDLAVATTAESGGAA